MAKFDEETTKPEEFGSSNGNGAIFGFCGRTSNGLLFAGRPRYKISVEKNYKTGCTLAISGISTPINVRIHSELIC